MNVIQIYRYECIFVLKKGLYFNLNSYIWSIKRFCLKKHEKFENA